MKYSIVVACLLFSIGLMSQKLVQNVTNDFTGQRIVETSWEKLFEEGGEGAYLRFRKIDTTFFIDFRLSWTGEIMRTLKPEHKLKLYYTANDYIELQTEEEIVACRGCGSSSVKTSYSLGFQSAYPIAKNQLKKIKESGVTKFYIETSEGFFDRPVKDKFRGKIISLCQIIFSV